MKMKHNVYNVLPLKGGNWDSSFMEKLKEFPEAQDAFKQHYFRADFDNEHPYIHSISYLHSSLTYDKAIEFMDLTKKGEILDIGCGAALVDIYLSKHWGFNCTGIDINLRLMKLGKMIADYQGVSDKVNFQEVDASKELPFEDSTYDVVMLFEVIEHIDPPLTKIMGEIFRVLKADGTLIITTPNQTNTRMGLPFFRTPEHVKEYNIAELTYMLNKSGFKIEDYSFEAIYFPFHDVLFNSLPREVKKNLYYSFSRKIVSKNILNFLGRTIVIKAKKQQS